MLSINIYALITVFQIIDFLLRRFKGDKYALRFSYQCPIAAMLASRLAKHNWSRPCSSSNIDIVSMMVEFAKDNAHLLLFNCTKGLKKNICHNLLWLDTLTALATKNKISQFRGEGGGEEGNKTKLDRSSADWTLLVDFAFFVFRLLTQPTAIDTSLVFFRAVRSFLNTLIHCCTNSM